MDPDILDKMRENPKALYFGVRSHELEMPSLKPILGGDDNFPDNWGFVFPKVIKPKKYLETL